MPALSPDQPGGDPRATKILFGRYELGRLLGCGAFAKVYHARNLSTGQSVAIKVISKSRVLRSGLTPNLRREILALRRLRHPHVIRLHEVLASRSHIFFVMDLARGGELFTFIANSHRLSEPIARLLFHQLISALSFCHSRGVFHRDLKPENLLLAEDSTTNPFLKISDFGLSACLAPSTPNPLLSTVCGTPAYVAPEVLSRNPYSGAAVDLWSCGVILFVLIAGYLPFNDPNLMNLYRKIRRGEVRFPRWVSPDLRRLISRLLDINPQTRLTLDGVLTDPWFRKDLDEQKLIAMTRFRQDIEDRIAKIERDDPRDLNAFDLIASSPSLDLSGLFAGSRVERERFVVQEEAAAVLDRVEAVGRGEGLVVRRRARGSAGRAGAAVEGQEGNLVAWVEAHRLMPGLVVVEVEVTSGDDWDLPVGRWTGRFWRKSLTEPATEPDRSDPD
ncbi:Non-specific serine/threonine protein kinase protein [Dioscorea alata]|uniref:Non-specific serine/threonine protein kinase protein n=1 Tax=Dioscorea alata TaxID=55571 RepID=A0ACB7U149_DIOAL|nr:Non-specific serine/threonine protein kinase protein [Dioscorea alata]